MSRRRFLQTTATGLASAGLGAALASTPRAMLAQESGDRPAPAAGVAVLNPRERVPVGLIIDDSTCLVNLNRFAMPQFDAAWAGANKTYHRDWRDWPAEIPDRFVRSFGEWCADQGVKGKYSIVPYPACVGRLDRELPGWTRREVEASLDLVRTLMMPNWDIHPEMVTHTRVIDLKSGHPVPEYSLKYMENWDWTTGRSADEIGAYMVYALQILKNVGLPCEGVTTPGGFGNRALPQLARATLQSVRDVFQAEVPHYFRHLYASGAESVAPRVEYASDLDSPNPRCVVSIIGCTGDWTGGWDNTPPAGADKFITEDLKGGRMVEVIDRGEPAFMVCHWTGIHWNGMELGFDVFKEVVRRLKARYDHLLWMKLSEAARYWAARELTRITRRQNSLAFQAPYACPAFTVRAAHPAAPPRALRTMAPNQPPIVLRRVDRARDLTPGTWRAEDGHWVACLDLPKGASELGWE